MCARYDIWVKKSWKRAMVGALVLMMTKVVWFTRCAPTGTMAEDREELLARRDHLLERTQSASFVDDHQLTPGGIFASEWQLVSLSMTASALANLAQTWPDLRTEHATACGRLVEQLLAPGVRAFERETWGSDPLEALDGTDGHIGYLGHLGVALAACRSLGVRDHEALQGKVANAIARRMVAAAPSFHIETYPGQRYTADNSVGVAALALWDAQHGGEYRATIDAWVHFTREHLLDPSNGLIVFGVSSRGEPLGRGRGSAAGYNSFYLPFVDAELAREQRARMQDHLYVTLPFDAVGVREYTDGKTHFGDVDTGPLVAGLSPSGTGFAMAAARYDGDAQRLRGLLRTAEGAGFTAPCTGGRCYLLAPLVGDAIVLAMRTATPWPDAGTEGL